mmetsp:Transcript_24796/g.65094  ORF Transcript_24796/g.65094 Transcript_24796/m.65094 type:complete len:136 (-) Transcript_24796:69-476(-)
MLLNNPPDAGSFRYKVGTTLLVSGLPTVRKTDVQGAFGDYGQILRIDLEAGRAYVEFDDERDALDALEMDGRKFQGHRLKVERTKTKEIRDQTPRHGAKGVHTRDRDRDRVAVATRMKSSRSRSRTQTFARRESR